MEAGYIVIRFHHREPTGWQIFRRHPDIFGAPHA